ncbi:MAG: hypothetical protein CMN30_32120 [Sandaracinus sp.]|nr:hypothetical protein [Sandaracinus sp.]|tara:strand:+ start:3892 stop:4344 length:453 start_codon:yes stop_codon:yes gene_type:complete
MVTRMSLPARASVLHETPFHRLTDHGSYLELVRSAEPYPDLAALEAEYRALVATQASFREGRRGLLVDLREAKGRNDPAFEETLGRWRKQSLLGFTPLVILVKSALGKMHVERHMRADGLDAMVSDHEEDARGSFRLSGIQRRVVLEDLE